MFRRYSHLIPPPPQLWSLLAPYASARIHCSRNFVIECISPVLIRKKFFHYESPVLFQIYLLLLENMPNMCSLPLTF